MVAHLKKHLGMYNTHRGVHTFAINIRFCHSFYHTKIFTLRICVQTLSVVKKLVLPL